LTFLGAVAVTVVLAVAAEIALPGRDIYHAGWFNVSLVASAAIAGVLARSQFARSRSNRARIGVVAIAFGAAVAGIAGATSGLLAPDGRTIVEAPGQTVRVDDLGGSLEFPLAEAETATSVSAGAVVLVRSNHRSLSIGDRSRNIGTFVLRTLPRDVAYVEARDSRGGRLTITQPTGSSFLSPVLLMQQRQTIAGLNVPFDSFAVPAAHRLVKAVLFTAQEADMMRGMDGGTGPAVLFAVDDENDRPLPHAIAAARSGATIGVGDLLLRALVFSYPAVEIVAVPSLTAVVTGALLVFGGLLAKGAGPDVSRP
jgi:hypothetical protein